MWNVDDKPTVEGRVLKAQDTVQEWVDGHSPLELQTMYQALYARGNRIPTDLHHSLRVLARKEIE